MNRNTSTPAILMHGKKSHYEHRPMYWFDPVTRIIILPDGTVKRLAGSMPLTSVLSGIEKHLHRTIEQQRSVTLFIRAGTLLKNKPSKQYFTEMGDGWVLDGFKYDAIQGNYSRNGFKVFLYGTGKYFGEAKDIIAIREAWHRLQSQLDDKFHYPNYMLSTTPAATGRELLRVSLPKDVQYERLSDETLDVIYRHCCYGGRVESFLPSRPALENGVYLLDGTWMFASCLSHLPTGPCIHEVGNRQPETYESARYGRAMPSYPGFYHVTATVPQNWHHLGLLKEWERHYRSDAEAHYPNTPGETFKSWTTADELVLALAHGWQITVHERLFFPKRQSDPFTTWYRKLADLREKASVGNTKNSLLKGAYRNIVLHTIGSFKQMYTWKDHIDLTDEQYRALEMHAIDLERYPRRKPGLISCRETVPLPRDRQPFVRPEWPAAVWGRARARLAEFALQLPYEDIVRLATDCVWSAITPDWVQRKADWNTPGEFVVKDHIKGPWSWPVDSAAMRRCVIAYNEAHNISEEASFDEDTGGE